MVSGGNPKGGKSPPVEDEYDEGTEIIDDDDIIMAADEDIEHLEDDKEIEGQKEDKEAEHLDDEGEVEVLGEDEVVESLDEDEDADEVKDSDEDVEHLDDDANVEVLDEDDGLSEGEDLSSLDDSGKLETQEEAESDESVVDDQELKVQDSDEVDSKVTDEEIASLDDDDEEDEEETGEFEPFQPGSSPATSDSIEDEQAIVDDGFEDTTGRHAQGPGTSDDEGPSKSPAIQAKPEPGLDEDPPVEESETGEFEDVVDMSADPGESLSDEGTAPHAEPEGREEEDETTGKSFPAQRVPWSVDESSAGGAGEEDEPPTEQPTRRLTPPFADQEPLGSDLRDQMDSAGGDSSADPKIDGRQETSKDSGFEMEPVGRRRRKSRRRPSKPASDELFEDEQEDTEPPVQVRKPNRKPKQERIQQREKDQQQDKQQDEQQDKQQDEQQDKQQDKQQEQWDLDEEDPTDRGADEPASEEPTAQTDDVTWSAMPQGQPSVMPDSGPTRIEPVGQPAPEPIGEKTLIFEDPSAQVEEIDEPDPPYLVIVQGEEEGREIDLLRDDLTMGRGPDNDLVFPDIACSRRHSILERKGDIWTVSDLDSGNGTLVNGERVHTCELYDGDEIEVGNTVLQFNLPGGAEAPEAGSSVPGRRSTTVTSAQPLAGASSDGFLNQLLSDPKRRKLVVLGGGILAGVIVIMLVIRLFLPSPPPEPTAEERKQEKVRAQRLAFEQAFESAKDLVKSEKWEKALFAMRDAEKLDPNNTFVRDYLVTIKRELEASNALEQAQNLVDLKNFEGAITAINRVGEDSTYVEKAKSLKGKIEGMLNEALFNDGQELMKEEKFSQALLKFDMVLKRNPGDEEVAAAKRRCEEAIALEEKKRKPVATGGRKKRRKRVHTVRKPKSGLTGQTLALYKNGEVDRAIIKADGSGASKEANLMRQFKKQFELGGKLAKNPGQASKATQALTQALKYDKRISGGKGKYNQDLKKLLGKVYFIRGVDAKTRQKYPEAYKSLNKALNYDSSLTKARALLDDLVKIARRFYQEAYIIKGTNPERAASQLKTVLKITPASDPYYTKAKKLLNTIEGPMGGDSGGDTGF